MQINFFERRSLFAFVTFCVVLAVGGIITTYIILNKELAPPKVATPLEQLPPAAQPLTKSVEIGQSVEKRSIVAHSFGTGTTSLLFVGGIHGGYEWNTVLLAEAMIEYFTENIESISPNITVHIVPVLNPDGLTAVANGKYSGLQATDITNWNSDGRGRFNANNVDLNRNFACKWEPRAIWRGNAISAGATAFSEPEAQALRDYVLQIQPEAVVFWHSVAGAVYGSECEDGILPDTLTIMNAYATAGQYDAIPVFDAYPVTGDAEGWLASIGIPAVTVELETRDSIEWQRNLAGTKALLSLLSNLQE